MRIPDYPRTTTLDQSNIFLLDGDNGTQSIQSKDLSNALLSTLTTQELLQHVDISELPLIDAGDISEENSSSGDNVHYFLVGDRNGGYEKMTFQDSTFLPIDAMGDTRSIGNRRCIWRNKNLGKSITNEQYAAIADGTFKDLFLGDYWRLNDIIWRIVDFDYWWGSGNAEWTNGKHHLVIMPDYTLGTTPWMSSSSGTSSGYFGSLLRDKIINDIVPNTIIPIFGDDHVMEITELITNSINTTTGLPNGSVWVKERAIAPTENMICGTRIYSQVSHQEGVGNDTTDYNQLSGFRLFYKLCNMGRQDYLLRDIASNVKCVVMRHGRDISMAYYTTNYGVRPVFAFC